MVKRLEAFGDRLLGLIVPRSRASACGCWIVGQCPDGGVRECCRIGGELWCDTCY
jgi:hypothetical protein